MDAFMGLFMRGPYINLSFLTLLQGDNKASFWGPITFIKAANPKIAIKRQYGRLDPYSRIGIRSYYWAL